MSVASEMKLCWYFLQRPLQGKEEDRSLKHRDSSYLKTTESNRKRRVRKTENGGWGKSEACTSLKVREPIRGLAVQPPRLFRHNLEGGAQYAAAVKTGRKKPGIDLFHLINIYWSPTRVKYWVQLCRDQCQEDRCMCVCFREIQTKGQSFAQRNAASVLARNNLRL